jgi:hypothetical protein
MKRSSMGYANTWKKQPKIFYDVQKFMFTGKQTIEMVEYA